MLTDRSALSLLSVAAALCHEAGHLLVMLLCGCEVREVEITMFGAEIRSLPAKTGWLGEIAILAAGGLANLICVPIALLFDGKHAAFFAVCSAMLAVLNLLPVRTLDGGCILSLLLARLTPTHAETILTVVSSVTLGLLWLAAGYLLLMSGGNLSLYLFCVYMFVTLYMRPSER